MGNIHPISEEELQVKLEFEEDSNSGLEFGDPSSPSTFMIQPEQDQDSKMEFEFEDAEPFKQEMDQSSEPINQTTTAINNRKRGRPHKSAKPKKVKSVTATIRKEPRVPKKENKWKLIYDERR